ncbi:hypothetical protein D3C80_426590 [compost metagenome]
MQDVGGFAHLDHEGRTAARQVIAGADTGEDAVDQRQLAAGCRHEAADMRHQHNQGRLAHVGGFTAHVRAGDHQHAGVVVQCQVVGHERRGQYLLDHRVATLADAHARLVDEGRAVQVQVQRALGEVAQHIQLGQGRGGVLQGRQMTDQGFQQRVVEHLLAGKGATLGRQCLVFEDFQFRGDEAFGTLERLPPNVVGRRLFGLLAWQLDEVAMHPVVADLEVGQAGAGFFPRFQIDKELAGVLAHGQQFVQFAVVAGFQYAAVTDDCGRVVDDGFFQQVGQFRVGAGDGRQARQVRCFELRHSVLQFRQGAQGIA